MTKREIVWGVILTSGLLWVPMGIVVHQFPLSLVGAAMFLAGLGGLMFAIPKP